MPVTPTYPAPGSNQVSSGISDKSRGIALLLCALLGPFGGHRFYAGKVKSGILMACTLGGLGIWYLYDLILVASGGFRDSEGRRIVAWDFDEMPQPELPEQIYQELDEMRREIAELHERVDFSERLLAGVRRESDDKGPSR
jgi:hypothetical protein